MPAPSDKPGNNRFGREPFRPRTDRPRDDRPRAGSFQQGEIRRDESERPAPDARPPRRNDRAPLQDSRQSFGQNERPPRRDDRAPRDARPPMRDSRPPMRDSRPAFGRDDRPRKDFGDKAPRFRQTTAPVAPVSHENDPDWNDPQKAVGGINEVEALLKNRPGIVHRVLFQKDAGDKRLYTLQKLVKHLHIHFQQLDVAQLDEQVRPHQGVVALCHEKEVNSWEAVRIDLFQAIASGTPKTVAVIVNIEDPRNLGACLRSALALGVDAVLIPSKGMCGLTPLTARASAGALSQLTLCRPDNLEGALGELVSAGYELIGLDADTRDSLHDAPFKAHTIIAVGGEDRDLPPFIRKQCTKVLRIPMMEEAHSYNASVALTLALYERARSNSFQGMLVSAEQYAKKQEAKRAEWASKKAAAPANP